MPVPVYVYMGCTCRHAERAPRCHCPTHNKTQSTHPHKTHTHNNTHPKHTHIYRHIHTHKTHTHSTHTYIDTHTKHTHITFPPTQHSHQHIIHMSPSSLSVDVRTVESSLFAVSMCYTYLLIHVRQRCDMICCRNMRHDINCYTYISIYLFLSTLCVLSLPDARQGR